MVAVMKRMLETRAAYALAVLWLMALAAHTLKPVLLPVVRDFTVTTLTQEGGKVRASGYMVKARPTCLFAGVVAYRDIDGERQHVPLLFQDATRDQTANRAAGYQLWGPWQMEIEANKPGVIHLESVHKCHPGWTTTTPLVAIPVGVKP